MVQLPEKLIQKLELRNGQNAMRSIPSPNEQRVDFSSNDYLGLAQKSTLFDMASKIVKQTGHIVNGATGSRLITGNHSLYNELEEMLAKFHRTEDALVFNSGYDANLGFFSSVPQRGDVVLYDEYIHASIRDGIQMGNSKSYKYKHNNLKDLVHKCEVERNKDLADVEIYVVTESVFSMDGDVPDLSAFAKICKDYNCRFIVDEAHALGVFGKQGEGLLQELNLHEEVFARIVTFGKGMGCHGAAILSSTSLKSYLVNFARSFIYTTGLSPHAVASVLSAYDHLQNRVDEVVALKHNITYFNQKLESFNLNSKFIPSNSAIHCCIISGNDKIRDIAKVIQEKGYDVRPIQSPTVPEGRERLRVCLHSFNTEKEIDTLLKAIADLM